MGSAVVAVADGDAALAKDTANELAELLWQHRRDFAGSFLTVEQAVEQAAGLPGPVCLLDMGDNVGGGSPGDGTWIVHALARRGLSSFACLFDPAAADQASTAGVGSEVELRVGGKTDDLHGSPLVDTFRVAGIYDGRFEETQPRHGGVRHFDQGITVVLENSRGLSLMVTSRRVPPFSLRQITSFGIEPTDFQVLVAKGVNAPLAAYREVCPHFLRVDTPGVTSADMRRLDYQHRRRPMYPFEPDTTWSGHR
jgi:microcystin degradation protein MlrC